MSQVFANVTLLITNYNRSLSLENLLTRFEQLDCRFGNIIVTDDGSKAIHLDRIRRFQQKVSFELLTSPKNQGAGHNMNKGQRAVKTPYTLFIEDDFEPSEKFPTMLRKALEEMDNRLDLDIVRFYAYFRYPYLKPYNEHFSEMVVPRFALNYRKIHYYSDHPHLRRTSFLDKFGDFNETTRPDQTEYRMCISFLQHGGKGLFYNDHQNLLYHNNSVEGSTIERKGWTMSESKPVQLLKLIYRQIKHNYDLYFMKTGYRYS